MNKPLRHVAVVGFVMMALLFASTSWIQFFRAEALDENPLNNRTLLDDLSRNRGPILVDGTPIAYSTPVDDTYKYQREYGAEGFDPEMYASLTGFYSIASGTTGLERAENSLLSGDDEALFFNRVKDTLTGQDPSGAAVEMTIDPEAQKAAWEGLGDQRGAAVALDPKTGKILAMVSSPGWDPNDMASHDSGEAQAAYSDLLEDDTDPLYNRAIGGNLYPPGSTFKLVTTAAALESGDYEPETEMYSPVTLDLPLTTATISNSGHEVCGPNDTATLQHALAHSCNTTFAQLGMDLGQETMQTQAEKFGFGRSFDMPLSVTASSFPADMNDPQLAQASIGQFEDRATPLQIAMISAAIANDGEEMTPQLINRVVDAQSLDLIEEPSPQKFSDPISKDTANKLTEMMTEVVESGTGTAAQIDGIDVAGKTGTAQHAEGAAPHAWFTGFAPADDPEVAVAVVVEDGGNAGSEAYGGSVSGPIAKSMMEAVIDK